MLTGIQWARHRQDAFCLFSPQNPFAAETILILTEQKKEKVEPGFEGKQTCPSPHPSCLASLPVI